MLLPTPSGISFNQRVPLGFKLHYTFPRLPQNVGESGSFGLMFTTFYSHPDSISLGSSRVLSLLFVPTPVSDEDETEQEEEKQEEEQCQDSS